MADVSAVLEYKCPCCDAPLVFGDENQRLTCEFCDNTFDVDTILEDHKNKNPDSADFAWEDSKTKEWDSSEQACLQGFTCSSCGGEILSDSDTAATFCPYCGNPAILPHRVSGGLKPDAVIPFQKGKDDAKHAFINLCKNKPLLPKEFTQTQQIEKITGMYVPFWIYDCEGSQDSKFKATRIHRWSDSRYHYTRTDHYLVSRSARASFSGIPMDGSSKANDSIMESIEPFDYSQLTDFQTAYLSGFLADKYDVEAKEGESRIRQRVESTLDTMIQSSILGYSTVIPFEKHLKVSQGQSKYVLLPVWMLHSRYRDKTYVFAMNGQTGKITGNLPICPKRSAAWFAGICAAVTLLVTFVQYVLM